ncbi:MAG: hypothetical protein AB7O26_15900 [Planctomycetaceae bacterium]
MRARDESDRGRTIRISARSIIVLICLFGSSQTFAQTGPAPTAQKVGKQRTAAPKIPAAPLKPAGPIAQSPVDVIRLHNGKTIRGLIQRENPDQSLSVAVSRDWLRKTDVKNLTKLEIDEFATRRTLFTQLCDRIRIELPARPNDSAVAYLLQSELQRAEKVLAETEWLQRPQFLWVDLPAKSISKLTRTSPERRSIALWSWYEDLAEVETRSAQDLASELKANNVDLSQPPPDFSDRIPGRVQDDREWNARMGLISYALDTPRDYHGTGDILLRVEPNANRTNLASIFQQFSSGNLDTILDTLEGIPAKQPSSLGTSNRWLNEATLETEKDKLRGLRATRVDLNLARREASVRSVFRARIDDSTWETIWESRSVQSADKSRALMETQIRQDPQLKPALDLMKSIGVFGQDQIQIAVRFGAATMSAQQAVDDEFKRFQEPYLKRLDGPPLVWPASPKNPGGAP